MVDGRWSMVDGRWSAAQRQKHLASYFPKAAIGNFGLSRLTRLPLEDMLQATL